jgi:hypothetical protein
MRQLTQRIATVMTCLVTTALVVSVSPAAVASAAPTTRPAAPAATIDMATTIGVALPTYETWISDVTLVANEARAYLKTRLADRPANTAIVLDIDNTSLESTYHGGFGFTTPATPPILALALEAKAAGAGIFFVTGRGLDSGYSTWTNISTVGYPIDDMYFYHMDRPMPVGQYKTNARIDIESKGYTIIANIGNNLSDLEGGHAERTFKLPDYNGQLS